MTLTSEQQALINAALDRTREIHNLSSDRRLAKHYKVSPKQISFWRNGRVTHNDAVLIDALTSLKSVQK